MNIILKSVQPLQKYECKVNKYSVVFGFFIEINI